jgi:hypothetical protein
MYFLNKNIRPTPWNVVMDIGPDIKIAVSGYRKVCLLAVQFMYFLCAAIYHSCAPDCIMLWFICSE